MYSKYKCKSKTMLPSRLSPCTLQRREGRSQTKEEEEKLSESSCVCNTGLSLTWTLMSFFFAVLEFPPTQIYTSNMEPGWSKVDRHVQGRQILPVVTIFSALTLD